MKMKFGALVVDGRGKIGGHVASRNRSGAYLRTKVTPVNPATLYQVAARALLTSLSQGWRALTQAQRTAWDAAVSDFAGTDIFGDLKNPTGKNLYTRLNANLRNAGQSLISSPPVPSGAELALAGALVITNGGAKTVAYTGATAASTVQVWATAGQSPGKKFVKSEYRLVTIFTGGDPSPVDIATEYEARFGEPAVGSKVFVQLRCVNNDTGETGQATETSTIVV